MKVLLINGSPKKESTYNALCKVAEAIEEEKIETEIVNLGNKPINDCIACKACYRNGNNRCIFNEDIVNEIIEKAESSDGFIFGSPVYYAHPTGRILSVLDRAFYAGKKAFMYKPGAAIAVARRSGTVSTIDVLNKYFTINQMPVVSSTYWNNVYGSSPEETKKDAEGMQTMRNLGKNMALILKNVQLGTFINRT